MTSSSSTAPIMTSQQFLEHWQGHRALTRRVIEAFPEDKLFNYSVGGMRPFSALAMEFIGMAVPTLNGVISGKWEQFAEAKATTSAAIVVARNPACGSFSAIAMRPATMKSWASSSHARRRPSRRVSAGNGNRSTSGAQAHLKP